MRRFQEGATMQVAMVVRDLEAAMKRHWETCGIGPWDIYQFEPGKVQNYIYRGKPATHTRLIAVAWNGDTQLELMQPLTGYSTGDNTAGMGFLAACALIGAVIVLVLGHDPELEQPAEARA